jgi:hypothetical protein
MTHKVKTKERRGGKEERQEGEEVGEGEHRHLNACSKACYVKLQPMRVKCATRLMDRELEGTYTNFKEISFPSSHYPLLVIHILFLKPPKLNIIKCLKFQNSANHPIQPKATVTTKSSKRKQVRALKQRKRKKMLK